MLLSTLLQ